MAISLSTGLRNAMLGMDGFKNCMDGGVIRIYAGTMPATADAAVGSATLLVTINAPTDGLLFESAASDGTILKDGAQTWSGDVAATGTATWYRHVGDPADDGTASTSAYRLQGDVGTTGKALNLSSISLTAAATQTIDHYSVSLPSA